VRKRSQLPFLSSDIVFKLGGVVEYWLRQVSLKLRDAELLKVVDTDVALSTDSRSLDQVRGVLFSLSNTDDVFFDSVSTQSIKCALGRRGRDGSPVDALNELYCVGDIQSLGRGRWLPSVTASVQIGQISVLISGMPTRLLSRVITKPIFGSGSCRLVGEPLAEAGIGSHQFQWWCGAPASTEELTSRTLRDATFPLEVTSHLQYFNHWDKSVSHRWSYGLPRSVPSSSVVLAREKGPIGTLYFLSKVASSKVAALQELSKDWNQAFRLGFGLRALVNNPATYAVHDGDGENCKVITPAFLPSPERKVLRALGPVVELQGTSQIVTTIPVGARSQVELMLRALGLSNEVKRL
jgi:hypothetical protein